MFGYTMSEPSADGVTMVQFPSFAAVSGITHGFSTRAGGVSEGIFQSMNLGFGRGDSAENVRENFRRAFAHLHIPEGAEVFTKQTHTTNLRIVTEEDRGTGLVREIPYTDTDGLVTNARGVALTLFCSDCVPVFFVDPVKKAIGVCHAGWRGTVGEIAGKTVRLLKDTYGCRPEDILAGIGPSIGPECFEVGSEVVAEFLPVFGEEVVIADRYPKPHIDLWRANAISILRSGVPEKNITVSGLCTMCRPETFFSHRATGGKRGSNAGFLMLS